MVDWSKLPDVGAVALLACAFASVARSSNTPASKIWLTAWVMIGLHFTALIFSPVSGIPGILAIFVALSALTWAGILFMWASVPFRFEKSSRWMVGIFLTVNTLYIGVSVAGPAAAWALVPAAVLFGALPLALTLFSIRRFHHPLRWAMALFYCALAGFLLAVQNRPDGQELALNAVLFTIYFSCCIHFLCLYHRATTGAFVTIAGFLAWASVFVVGPLMAAFWPQVHIEGEVWNLPKYVVAVGMILILLENQIEDNKYLALHDALTGLPNRRLFQDRLASALERARRTKTQTALLVVDLNRFKLVNDTLGHHIGDLLLRHVASVLNGRVRRSDTVARTGGDEFSVILEEPTSREEARSVGNSLHSLLKQPLRIGDQWVRVSASIGIAVFPEDAGNMESLCIAADLRMYDVKNASAPFAEHVSPKMENLVAPASCLANPGLQDSQ